MNDAKGNVSVAESDAATREFFVSALVNAGFVSTLPRMDWKRSDASKRIRTCVSRHKSENGS